MIVFKHRYPARDFLTKGQGCSILQMRLANLDDILKGVRFLMQGLVSAFNCGISSLRNASNEATCIAVG